MRYSTEIDSLIGDNYALIKEIYEIGLSFTNERKTFAMNPMVSRDSKEKQAIKSGNEKLTDLVERLSDKAGELEHLAAQYCVMRAAELIPDDKMSPCVTLQQEVAYVRTAGINAVFWVIYTLRSSKNLASTTDFLRTSPSAPKSSLS